MAEPGDVLMPNSLPPELNNLIVVIFVCLFVLWTFRLCRNGLHLQDLRAGTSQNLVRVHASPRSSPLPPRAALFGAVVVACGRVDHARANAALCSFDGLCLVTAASHRWHRAVHAHDPVADARPLAPVPSHAT